MKTCKVCGSTKPIEEFVKDNRRKSGYRNMCKGCKKIENKENRLNKKVDKFIDNFLEGLK